MNSKIATVGNTGPKVRSDCEITLEARQKGGIVFNLVSRVNTLYGESIKSLCMEVLDFFKIKNAQLSINDSGALPFVIMARLEAAIKKISGSDMEYLPGILRENTYSTTSDRTRFSRLYLPGNNPGLMINAGLHNAYGIILDLEDSVANDKKEEARILVRNALRQVDFRGAERMVRINQGDTGLNDLQSVIPHNVNLILIPKCEAADQVKQTDEWIDKIRSRLKIRNRVFLMPIIESALGVENAFGIATASKNIVALAIGLEDFTADIGVQRTPEGRESLFARTRLVVAAKAAGIQPIDSVYSDVADIEALKQNVLESKGLGFEGMGCIHPRQIRILNQGYAPDNSEIERSSKIVMAFDEATKRGLSVVALGSKMIDPPVVARAQKTMDLAVKLGLISERWREDFIK